MEQPPIQLTPVGALRFNTDSSRMEYYDGNQWVNISSDSPEVQTGGTRGITGGGQTPSQINTIDYITIATTGNATDFGDLPNVASELAGCSSRTVGLWGSSGPAVIDINKVTISSTGNAAQFGDLSTNRFQSSACSSSTRGVWSGGVYPGWPSFKDEIDYVTIASDGNAVDFGNMLAATTGPVSFSSPTRGIVSGGYVSPGTYQNTIQYITIATLGNAADFGDMPNLHGLGFSASNAVRGLTAGGSTPSKVNTINYITMASLGNGIDFGDLTQVRDSIGDGGCASSTRGVFAGARTDPSNAVADTIDYVQIMTTGNAVDFGNLTVARDRCASLSNGHGGLG